MLRINQCISAATLALVFAFSGCALYRNDRCYVPPRQYQIARDLFIRSGSLDLVRQQLEEYQWRRCRINETIYRLAKEFEVLPEVIPATGETPQMVSPKNDLNAPPSTGAQPQ